MNPAARFARMLTMDADIVESSADIVRTAHELTDPDDDALLDALATAGRAARHAAAALLAAADALKESAHPDGR